MAPSKSSRKGKKAWRKNIDTQQVEDGLEQHTTQQRQGPAVDSLPDEQLFFVDKARDDSTAAAHQEAVAEAVAAEMSKLYKRELEAEAPPAFVDYQPETDEMALLQTLEEGAGEEGEEGDGDDAVPGEAAARRADKKNKAMRNKEARRRAAEVAEEERRRLKRQRQDLANLHQLDADISSAETARQARLARRAVVKAERMASEPPRLGKQRFNAEPVQVLLSDEISGSLRKLKPAAALARDRFKSLQKRGNAVVALQKKNQELVRQLQNMREQCSQQEAAQATQTAQHAERRQQDYEQAVREVQVNLAQQQQTCRELQRQEAGWKLERQHMSAKFEQLQRKCHLLADAKEEAENTLRKQLADTRSTQDEQALQIQQLKHRCRELELKETRLEAALASTRDDTATQTQKLAEAATREAELTGRLHKLEDETRVLRRQHQALSQRSADQEGQILAERGRVKQLQADRECQSTAQAEAQQQQRQLADQVAARDEVLSQMEAKLTRRRQQQEAAEHSCAAAQAASQHSNKTIQVLLAANERLQAAILGGLGLAAVNGELKPCCTEVLGERATTADDRAQQHHSSPVGHNRQPNTPRNYRDALRISARNQEALRAHLERQAAARNAPAPSAWEAHQLAVLAADTPARALPRCSHRSRLPPKNWKPKENPQPDEPVWSAPGGASCVLQSLEAEYAAEYSAYQSTLRQIGKLSSAEATDVGDDVGEAASHLQALHGQLQEAVEILEIKASQIATLRHVGL
ncbi:hypothetical protein WJX72_002013 [[Myrmecia] bisecta]|uniref:Ribosome biogenesis protein NOP53 n=1 Tax=[Myrmecia] bisecta TaxID=41462 RepID=A0AAW1R599_9CHLO